MLPKGRRAFNDIAVAGGIGVSLYCRAVARRSFFVDEPKPRFGIDAFSTLCLLGVLATCGGIVRDTIFIIDQPDDERRRTADVVGGETVQVRTFESVEVFLEKVTSDVAGCIIAREDLAGIGIRALIKAIRARAVPLPVIVIGRGSDLTTAVELVRAGAVEYLEPPVSDRRLRSVVRKTLAQRRS